LSRPDTTPIGTLDGWAGATVDRHGGVEVDAHRRLEWWIGADDRWHLPAREATARQALLGNAPVVETRVRIPGGDAVHRAYGARDAQGNEHVVVDIENASRAPLALALVFRDAIEVEDNVVRDRRGLVAVLPRKPARLASGDDLERIVTSGEAGTSLGPKGPAALILPLAHTVSMRVVLPLDGQVPAALPSAEQVAAGWARFTERGTQLSLPDSGLMDDVQAARAQLLLETGRGRRVPIGALAALDAEGFHDEAARILRELNEQPTPRRGDEELFEVAVRHWQLTRDGDLAEDMLPLLGQLARRIAKRDGKELMTKGFADLLDGVGQPKAARAIRPGDVGWTRSHPGGWEGLAHHRAAGGIDLLAAIRARLLFESIAPHLAVLPAGIGPWARQPVELHRAPTAFGSFSFALRWHGERPALLWELDAHEGVGPVRITAPGLTRSWSSDAHTGEELLATNRDDEGGGAAIDPGGSFT
jgi:hypothetical protein